MQYVFFVFSFIIGTILKIDFVFLLVRNFVNNCVQLVGVSHRKAFVLTTLSFSKWEILGSGPFSKFT